MAFGQQLAQLFHAWCEFSSMAEDCLEDLVSDIQRSVSALKYLQDLVDEDKADSDGAFKVFTPAALDQIDALGLKCDLIFKAVMLLISRAAEARKLESNANKGEDEDKGSDKPKADGESDLLIGPVPDPASHKTLGLFAWVGEKWSWLSDRVRHCQEQLRWVRKGLLLQLQIAKLARLQLSR